MNDVVNTSPGEILTDCLTHRSYLERLDRKTGTYRLYLDYGDADVRDTEGCGRMNGRGGRGGGNERLKGGDQKEWVGEVKRCR